MHIDDICEILNCTPGEAPERVAEMKEQLQVRPVSEPPDTEREVLAYWSPENHEHGYVIARFKNKQWVFGACVWLELGNRNVVAWQELPPAPKEKK